MTKKLSIIVVNYGTPDLIVNFLKSAMNSADSGIIHEVIIVDNGYSRKRDSRKIVNSSLFPFKIIFVQNPKSSYASGVNQGAALASEETLVISNSDIEWLPEFSIQPLLDYLWRNSRIGVVGPQLVYPNNTWQLSYKCYPSIKEALISLIMFDSLWHGITRLAFRYGWLSKRPKMVDYISGAFMVVRRSCFEKLKGFNEHYFFYGEDADFCWRAYQHGWKVAFIPTVYIMHVGGASSTLKAFKKYTIQLLKAKQKFIKEHFSCRKAIWYIWLTKVAFLERVIFYSFVTILTRSSNWKNRVRQAKDCYEAAKRIQGAKE